MPDTDCVDVDPWIAPRRRRPRCWTYELSESVLRNAIRTWCRSTRYWTCLVDGAPRVDLTGRSAGHVAATEASGSLHAARTALPNSALWRRRGKLLKSIDVHRI
ncbi:ProQ/FINO family protein [Cupriavidus sp. 8B]